ncbi:MAG TPA: MarR family transcriptional regulator [Candidatus Dormibacteraeota bacterium]|nr:MarR family transcriptional regulator [Candidatus Dormibacteraeota bacterium]
MVGVQEAEPVEVRDEQAVSTLLFHLGRELRTALDRRFESHGITSQQAALLLLSRLVKEPSPIKMAARLGTDAAGMTRLLDRLERKQLIVRRASPDDRRLVVVELGPRGKRVLPRLVPEFRWAEKGLLDGFTTPELEQLQLLLRKLLKNARSLNA